MKRSSLQALCLLSALGLTACGGEETPKPFVPIQGAAIDGSDDAIAAAAPEGEDLPAPVVEDAPAPEVIVEPKTEGPLELTFWELALEELDADAMLDAFLFPEEWSDEEREELAFPPDLLDLVGREITLEGYIIPGEVLDGNLRDFMLVRDLQACCFGGAPRPDEWIDVVMDKQSSAKYHRYLPVLVTGTFSLGGEQDSTGKALGVFKLAGKSLSAED